jgi:hypothetical protein
MAVFDYKNWNAEVFQKYVKIAPDLKKDAILKSGALILRQDLAQVLKDGVGGNYIVEPMKAQIGGTADNYDGATNISTDTRKTFTQGKIVIGRAHAWKEKDFSKDVTGGVDFKATAGEVKKFFSHVNEDDLLAILEGIFASTDTSMATFIADHTLDLSAETDPTIGATSLNDCCQKALGDNKDAFALAIMHSKVATQLENKQLITYWVYNDANGMQRAVNLYSWNGRLVITSDRVPYDSTAKTYTTYVFGLGAFEYADLPVNVPFEMDRTPLTNGGETYIVGRERVLFAPVGISYAPATIPVSPTNAQLKSATAWKLASDNDATNPEYFPHKAIAIARIISK